jgi:CRISP-associated protein Cas1
MSSLYIDRRNITVKLENDALVFHESEQRIGTVPIAPLERVYVRGDVILSSSLLGRLGNKGIGVVILSGRKAEASLFLPRPHNDARIRILQYEASCNAVKTLSLAQATVYAKLKSQSSFLKLTADLRKDIRKPLLDAAQSIDAMMERVFQKKEIDSLRGLEGASAAAYFAAYIHLFPPEVNFKNRNRRPPKDPVNACLSLSYTLLHSEVTLAAYGHGFDPYIGFLHKLDFGRESLVCDLVEPLRAEMDHFVWRLFAEQIIRARDFSMEKDGSCFMGKAARETFYARVEQPLEKIRKQLCDTLKNLRHYILETNADD